MITLLPNDHDQDVTSIRFGRTQHVYYTQATASTYVLLRAYSTYWNKADYLDKLLSKLAAVLKVEA
jgi:membrane protease subunit (stomatin/prohibitin family)